MENEEFHMVFIPGHHDHIAEVLWISDDHNGTAYPEFEDLLSQARSELVLVLNLCHSERLGKKLCDSGKVKCAVFHTDIILDRDAVFFTRQFFHSLDKRLLSKGFSDSTLHLAFHDAIEKCDFSEAAGTRLFPALKQLESISESRSPDSGGAWKRWVVGLLLVGLLSSLFGRAAERPMPECVWSKEGQGVCFHNLPAWPTTQHKFAELLTDFGTIASDNTSLKEATQRQWKRRRGSQRWEAELLPQGSNPRCEHIFRELKYFQNVLPPSATTFRRGGRV